MELHSPTDQYEHDHEAYEGNPIRRQLIAGGCEPLQTLDRLRNVGWSSPKLDKHFEVQRKVSTFASFNSQEYWFKRSIEVMEDMDAATAVVSSLTPDSVQRRFLDLGFCPGGYTKYILDTYPTMRGVGVSLPIYSGGYTAFLQLPQPRLKAIFADLTHYQLGSQAPTAYGRLPVLLRSVDLVIMDAHPLREHTEDEVYWRKSSRLLISQLVLGLQSLRVGGNAILTLSRPENPMTARLIYLFDQISSNVVLHKPTNIWAQRGSFYLVAFGVGQGDDSREILQHALECFRKLWDELMFGGEEEQGRGLFATDYDFIVSVDEIVDIYVDRLGDLGRGVWETQIEGLTRRLVKNNVAV